MVDDQIRVDTPTCLAATHQGVTGNMSHSHHEIDTEIAASVALDTQQALVTSSIAAVDEAAHPRMIGSLTEASFHARSGRRTSGRPTAVRPVAPLPVSVVIPTWNEGANIGYVLAAMPDVEELIIVDACSDDGTVETVRRYRPDATIVLQEPCGKGNAVRAGLEIATSTYIISMDADGSMDPREIPAFVALLENGHEVVKGSRGAVGGGSTDFTPLRRAGNFGLVSLYNLMFGTRLSDITFGYIGFRRDVLPRLGLYAQGFEIEVQMVTHAQLAGLTFAELPSREADRLHGESHLNTFKDGRRVLKTILQARMSPGREWWRYVGAEAPVYRIAPPALELAHDDLVSTSTIPAQRRSVEA